MRNNGWENLLSLLKSCLALQSVGSKSCHLFEESFTAAWNIFFGEVVVMVPNRLNLGKLKSFTVRNPGKIHDRALFCTLSRVFGKGVVEHGAGIT